MENKIADVIIVIKDGVNYNISNTSLISSYREERCIPETDKLLDWRLRLMDRLEYYKATEDEFSERLAIREIVATDYILDLRYKK